MDEEELSYEDEEELQKKLISLLLKGADNPINSKINFQKELFLLIRSFPKFSQLFDFKEHRYGPYSNIAEQIVENYQDLFDTDNDKLVLTEEGKKYGEQVLDELDEQNRAKILKTVKLIRSIYDKLDDKEFMFLIYMTYGYTQKSDVFYKLMQDRVKYATRIYKKGIISHKRYLELIGD